ncbi:hypothetical protein TDB9533_03127 [Thalassocella blandensis]|nr:hypothetical protein TDB9533_03127 [Thalassocella blandensis]
MSFFQKPIGSKLQIHMNCSERNVLIALDMSLRIEEEIKNETRTCKRDNRVLRW